MKTKILTLLLITGLAFFNSCDTNDDETILPPPIEHLTEVWNLENVFGGLMGTNIDYNLGEVIWIFNITENTLKVYNNIISTGPEDIHAGFETGVYDFIITKEGDDQVLYVDDRKFGVVVVSSDGTLTIDEGLALDGFVSTFKRSETLNGSFQGSFKRDDKTANVTLNLNNNVFSGTSDVDKFPAICNGIYTISENNIFFMNECIWTADFDWTLILSGNWSYDLNPNSVLTMTEDNGDQYILTKL